MRKEIKICLKVYRPLFWILDQRNKAVSFFNFLGLNSFLKLLLNDVQISKLLHWRSWKIRDKGDGKPLIVPKIYVFYALVVNSLGDALGRKSRLQRASFFYKVFGFKKWIEKELCSFNADRIWMLRIPKWRYLIVHEQKKTYFLHDFADSILKFSVSCNFL